MIRVACILIFFTTAACGMVLVDSRVLTPAELADRGVQVQVAELPGPKDARRIWFTVVVRPLSESGTFQNVAYSILEKPLNADFTSARKGGVDNPKGKVVELSGEVSVKPYLRFGASEDQISNGYIVVKFDLPRRNDRVPEWGIYYLPLRDIRRDANPLISVAIETLPIEDIGKEELPAQIQEKTAVVLALLKQTFR